MSSTPMPVAPQRPTGNRWLSKRFVVFAGVIGGIAGLAMSTRTWIHVVPASGAINVQAFDVSGKDAATAVAALAVVALAGSVAAAIAGRLARWVIAVLVLLSGLGIAASALTALADPVAASVSKVGASAGTMRIQGDYAVTFWPWLTVVIGVWIMASAIWLAIAGRTWRTSRKYTPATVAPVDGATSAPGSTTDAADGADASTAAGETGSLDEIDGWDSLSRGEDPTR